MLIKNFWIIKKNAKPDLGKFKNSLLITEFKKSPT